MQHNMLRWFYQAYVNRMGAHFIELLSGRLAIGAEQYRRLTRKALLKTSPQLEENLQLTIVVAGTPHDAKSRLVTMLRGACSADQSILKARLSNYAIEPELLDRLCSSNWVEAPEYTSWTDAESRRDRARRQAAIEAAVQADLLILVIDGREASDQADVAFAQAWDRWYVEHPRSEVPPTLVVLTGVEGAEFGEGWHPPYDWSAGHGPRETAVRGRIEALRSKLPPSFADFVAISLSDQAPFGLVEYLMPELAMRLHRAERTALLRRLHQMGERSKVGRLVKQLGDQGRTLWGSIRSRQKARSGSS